MQSLVRVFHLVYLKILGSTLTLLISVYFAGIFETNFRRLSKFTHTAYSHICTTLQIQLWIKFVKLTHREIFSVGVLQSTNQIFYFIDTWRQYRYIFSYHLTNNNLIDSLTNLSESSDFDCPGRIFPEKNICFV